MCTCVFLYFSFLPVYQKMDVFGPCSSLVCNLRSEQPQRPRTWISENMESLISPRYLERPPTGERKEQPQSQEKKQQEKDSSVKGKVAC